MILPPHTLILTILVVSTVLTMCVSLLLAFSIHVLHTQQTLPFHNVMTIVFRIALFVFLYRPNVMTPIQGMARNVMAMTILPSQIQTNMVP